MSDKPQSPRCVFCGSAGLTREHIFPKWLRKVAPEPEGIRSYYNLGSQIIDGGKPLPPINRTRVQSGGIQSHRLKIVCSDCNSGWMSRLQSRAKPIVTELLKSTSFAPSDSERAILAMWATMFTMVVEFADLSTIATRQIERKDFAQTPRPLDNWIVWIGRAALIPFNFEHFAWGDQPKLKDSPIPETVADKCDSQTTTFAIGKIFFHTYSTNSVRPILGSISSEMFALQYGLFVVWPKPTIPYSREGKFTILGAPGVKNAANAFIDKVIPGYSQLVK